MSAQVQISSVYADFSPMWGYWRMKRTKAQRHNLYIFGAQKVHVTFTCFGVCVIASYNLPWHCNIK